MSNYVPKENKRSSSTNPIKQIYKIGEKTIIVIHESLVKDFKLNEPETWLEQISTKEGILLKPVKDGRFSLE